MLRIVAHRAADGALSGLCGGSNRECQNGYWGGSKNPGKRERRAHDSTIAEFP
jgi:hypothetical protein